MGPLGSFIHPRLAIAWHWGRSGSADESGGWPTASIIKRRPLSGRPRPTVTPATRKFDLSDLLLCLSRKVCSIYYAGTCELHPTPHRHTPRSEYGVHLCGYHFSTLRLVLNMHLEYKAQSDLCHLGKCAYYVRAELRIRARWHCSVSMACAPALRIYARAFLLTEHAQVSK
jgi:hypothetical protein